MLRFQNGGKKRDFGHSYLFNAMYTNYTDSYKLFSNVNVKKEFYMKIISFKE